MRRGRSTPFLALVTAAVAALAACSSSGGTSVRSSSASGGVAAASSDVSFVVDKTTTYGTLEIPAHRRGQRLAAALLIPGSGPTDRNGNDAGLGDTAGTLQIVAALLAKQGIMSFRYDKYFAGRTGAGNYANDPGSITMQSFFTQADAAYAFMAQQPQADPAKLLVVGHSEGGMVALDVATSVSAKPAGLALLEPQDERILDLIQIQVDENINAMVAQGTLTADQARTNAALVATAITAFRAGHPADADGMAPQVEQLVASELFTPDNATFERTNDLVVPATLAAGVRAGTRVLVTDGTRDPNVPPSTIGPLVKALTAAGTTGPGLHLLSGTDHYLHLARQPDTQAVLAPAAITAIEQWAQPFG